MRPLEPHRLLWLLALLLPLALLVGLSSGQIAIGFTDLVAGLTDSSNQWSTVVTDIRAPRVLLAAVTGATLAICGAVLQGLFRNPLADPTLIGVSAGASAGASFMIVFGGLFASGFTLIGLPLVALPLVAIGAFVGGLGTAWLVYRLATTTTGTSVATMLLAGIAMSAMAGAISSLLSYIADNEMLRRISLWQMGNFGSADWPRAVLGSAICGLLLWVFPRYAQALNAMLLGESEARHLGIDVARMKRRLILWVALGVGISVAIAGMVAFVGLIIPHLVRILIGPNHRYLLPASALAGATLLILADTVARVIIAPTELPTGIITALLGAPFFVSLLIQHRKLTEV